MRPIDADALASKLRDKADELIPLEEGSRGNTSIFYTGVKVGLQNAAIVADDFPTIEPKKGKWIKIGDSNSVQCSECLDDFDYIDGLCYLCHGQELPNYCPNCGAAMERSEE